MRARRGTWALGLLLGCSAEALEGPVKIELHSRTVELDRGLDAPLTEALKEGEHDHVLAILLFRRDVAPEDHRTLREAGIDLLEFLGQDAYSAAVPAGGATPWGVLDALVRAGTAVIPDDKVSPALAEVAREAAGAAAEKDGPSRVVVAFRSAITPEESAKNLASLGLRGEPVGDGRSYEVDVDEASIDRLAIDPDVQWIEQVEGEVRLHGELANAWVNAARVQRLDLDKGPPPAKFEGLSGAGAHVAICDDGIEEENVEFQQIGAGVSRVEDPMLDLDGEHGTAVASIVGARGAEDVAEGYPTFVQRGIAPDVRFTDMSFVNNNLLKWHRIVQQAPRCDVSNHSYPIAPWTAYNLAKLPTIEDVIRGDAVHAGVAIASRPAVFSAGNLGDGDLIEAGVPQAGYYSIQAVAKNPIAVGSIDAFDGRVSRTSSLGPTIDGRIKPDVVAPGAYDSIPAIPMGLVVAGLGDTHKSKWGTSIAAPVVTGVLALVAEQRNESGIGADTMVAATYKAILVAGARDLVAEDLPPPGRSFPNKDTGVPVRYHVGPDWATGFGLVDAPRTVEIVAENRWTQGVLAFDGQQHVHCVQVPPGADELRVALAWDDVPGALALGPAVPRLVNDLDLEVVAPDGTIVRPWTLCRPPQAEKPAKEGLDPIDAAKDLPPATRGPAPDRVNNVELVSLPEPMCGSWLIRVRAHDLDDPDGGTQRYGIATSHPLGLCLVFEPDPGHAVVIRTLCERYPTLCSGGLVEPPPFDPIGRSWSFGPRSLLSLDELCKFVERCPECPSESWMECRSFSFRVSGLPTGSVLHVLTDEGQTVANAEATHDVVRLTVDRPRRDRRYFLHATGPGDQALRESVDLRIEPESIHDGR